MGTCAQCQHFRRVKPASQLLGAVFGASEAKVADALAKVVDDEQKVRDAEAEYKRAEATRGKDDWPTRPVMSDYCGLDEGTEVFHVLEVRNAGGKCKDFLEGARPLRACGDCSHRSAGTGVAEDHTKEATLATLVTSSHTVEHMSTDSAEGLLQKHRDGVAARRALELSGAYTAHGHMAVRPMYLDTCDALSASDDFVVCALQNPHSSCALWEHGAASSAAAPPADVAAAPPADVAAAPPAEVAAAPPTTVASAAPPAVAPLAAAAPAAPPTAASAVAPPPPPTPGGPAPTSVTLSPDTVLAPGNPPLTAGLADGVIAGFGWLLGVTIPAPLADTMRAGLVAQWALGSAGLISIVSAHEQAAQHGQAFLDFQREAAQPQFVAMVRTNSASDPLAQELVNLYDAANPPLAAGDPPLTQEIADSYLDLLTFWITLPSGAPWQPASPIAKQQFAASLALGWPSLGATWQQWLAMFPLEWTKTRAGWEMLDEAQREQMRPQLTATLTQAFERYEGLVEKAESILGVVPTPAGGAPATQPSVSSLAMSLLFPGGTPAPGVAGVAGPYAPATGLPGATAGAVGGGFEGERSTDELLNSILEADRAKEEQLEQEDPEMALQVKMQHDMAHAQMLSNMMSMQHQASMAIINNMRA